MTGEREFIIAHITRAFCEISHLFKMTMSLKVMFELERYNFHKSGRTVSSFAQILLK